MVVADEVCVDVGDEVCVDVGDELIEVVTDEVRLVVTVVVVVGDDAPIPSLVGTAFRKWP